jgi:hypothetical protein
LEFDIPELKIVIHKIQHRRIIGCIEYRTFQLNLDSSSELISRKLVGKVYNNIAVDPFGIAENMIGPDGIVHEFIDITLHRFKNLAVGTLNFLSRNLNITVKLLGINYFSSRYQNNQKRIF